MNVVVMRNPDHFFRQARRIDEVKATTKNPALDHLLAVQNDLYRSARLLSRKVTAGNPLKTPFPRTPIGRNLATAARLISSDTGHSRYFRVLPSTRPENYWPVLEYISEWVRI